LLASEKLPATAPLHASAVAAAEACAAASAATGAGAGAAAPVLPCRALITAVRALGEAVAPARPAVGANGAYVLSKASSEDSLTKSPVTRRYSSTFVTSQRTTG
jgi:hypothetical protein